MNANITCVLEKSERIDAQDGPDVSGAWRLLPRVLFVDDEPRVLAGVQLALHDQPYEIRTTTQSDSALEMQREHPFDVIVADECMPGMQGSELLTAVAREFPTVGRIVLTGHASVESALRAINQAGVVRYLLKPCAPVDLREAIEAALRTRIPRRVGRGAAFHAASRIQPETTDTHAAMDVRSAALLEGALGAHELVLHAQKFVSLEKPAAAVGYELLTRVQIQEGRILTLPEFVSAGHGHLLLPSLDQWVVRHIMPMLHGRGRTLSRSGLMISLNLSAQSVSDAGFLRFLGKELRRSGIAERVLIEIPEQAAVDSLHSGIQPLRSLSKSGCRLCIDGVGPDLKRLAVLRQLPIELAKIDGQLVRAALTDPRAKAAVCSIVGFAMETGMRTVAKCVETVGQAEQLRKLGVHLGQGYAFGPVEPFARVLGSL